MIFLSLEIAQNLVVSYKTEPRREKQGCKNIFCIYVYW